jgi:magnesium chelatase family protein
MMLTEEKANEVALAIATERRNTLLVGPPGSGHTMVARRVAHFLTPTDQQRFDIEQVYRVAGLGSKGRTTEDGAPLRAPHHTVSTVAMAGSSPYPRTSVPRFGEVSLAHGGVLYLDELPEFHNPVIHLVANAMRDKVVRFNTRLINVAYPADFVLVAGAYRCPCGPRRDECRCTPKAVEGYRSRIKKVEDLCNVIDLEEVAA